MNPSRHMILSGYLVEAYCLLGSVLKPSWSLVLLKKEQSHFPSYLKIFMFPLPQCRLSKIYFQNQNMCQTGLLKSQVADSVTQNNVYQRSGFSLSSIPYPWFWLHHQTLHDDPMEIQLLTLQ